MILTPRAPWQQYWSGWGASSDAPLLFTNGGGLYQGFGISTEITRSNHVEFNQEQWRQILFTDYVEVVLTDLMVALRAPTVLVTQNLAELRRFKRPWYTVWIPLFNKTHLRWIEGE